MVQQHVGRLALQAEANLLEGTRMLSKASEVRAIPEMNLHVLGVERQGALEVGRGIVPLRDVNRERIAKNAVRRCEARIELQGSSGSLARLGQRRDGLHEPPVRKAGIGLGQSDVRRSVRRIETNRSLELGDGLPQVVARSAIHEFLSKLVVTQCVGLRRSGRTPGHIDADCDRRCEHDGKAGVGDRTPDLARTLPTLELFDHGGRLLRATQWFGLEARGDHPAQATTDRRGVAV